MSGRLRDAWPVPFMHLTLPSAVALGDGCRYVRERRARSTVPATSAGEFTVLIAALRDLQWRRRRFIIAIVGTGVVFAMTLVLTGLANGFSVEANDTVDDTGVDHWMIPSGAAGPFLGSSPFPDDAVAAARQIDGVTGADAASVLGHDREAGRHAEERQRVRRAHRWPGDARGVEGRGAEDGRRDHGLERARQGRRRSIEIGSSTLDVVGVVNDSTALAGTPNVFLTVEGAQAVMFAGQPLISSVALEGSPADAPGRLPDRRPERRGRRHPPATRRRRTARSRSWRCCSGSSPR